MTICGNVVNHCAASIQQLDRHMRFGMDKERTAVTRVRISNMPANKRMPFTHRRTPFLAIGFVEKTAARIRHRFASMSYRPAS